MDAQDTLMKYLYKGMALPGWGDVSGSVLLGWHEKVSTLDAKRLSYSAYQSLLSVNGGCGYRLHRARHDGQKNCMRFDKRNVYYSHARNSDTTLPVQSRTRGYQASAR